MKQLFTFGGMILSLLLFSCQAEKNTSSSQFGEAPQAFTADDAAAKKKAGRSEAHLAPLPISSQGYASLNWDDLAKVTFEEKYYEEVEGNLLFPIFSDEVKALEGQKLSIEGYVIPLSPGRYVLSANPFASCFFCGNAGPESVLELYLQDTTAVYFSDDFVRFGGVLQLNDSDIDHLNYILREALPVKD